MCDSGRSGNLGFWVDVDVCKSMLRLGRMLQYAGMEDNRMQLDVGAV